MADYEKKTKFLNIGYILQDAKTKEFTVMVRAFGSQNILKTQKAEAYIAEKVENGMKPDSAEKLQEGFEKGGVKYVILRETADGNTTNAGTIRSKDKKTSILFDFGKEKVYVQAQNLTDKDKEFAPDNAYKRLLLVVDQ